MLMVETEEEFENFLQILHTDQYVLIPIFSSYSKHVRYSDISLIYVESLRSDLKATLCFNHIDSMSLSYELLKQLPFDRTTYVFQKKRLLYHIPCSESIDIDMVSYFVRNRPVDNEFLYTGAHRHFQDRFYAMTNLARMIPIVKHIEYCSEICKILRSDLDLDFDTTGLDMYSGLGIDSLFSIESNGLSYNEDVLTELYPSHRIDGDLLFSEYNMFTTTGRPSNRFAGINYAALNKDDGTRLIFNSRYERGMLLSFDYESYHLRLLATLVGYKFPDDVSAHEYLGRHYFKTDVLTSEQITESKKITFRQLYGGVQAEYRYVPFLAAVDKFADILWDEYNRMGYIRSPVFNRRMDSLYYTDMNRYKLLNYYIQSMETERNYLIIGAIVQHCGTQSCRLILYTYDSFLFDYDRSLGPDILYEIKSILEQDGAYPTKLEVGLDYQNMKLKQLP